MSLPQQWARLPATIGHQVVLFCPASGSGHYCATRLWLQSNGLLLPHQPHGHGHLELQLRLRTMFCRTYLLHHMPSSLPVSQLKKLVRLCLALPQEACQVVLLLCLIASEVNKPSDVEYSCLAAFGFYSTQSAGLSVTITNRHRDNIHKISGQSCEMFAYVFSCSVFFICSQVNEKEAEERNEAPRNVELRACA